MIVIHYLYYFTFYFITQKNTYGQFDLVYFIIKRHIFVKKIYLVRKYFEMIFFSVEIACFPLTSMVKMVKAHFLYYYSVLTFDKTISFSKDTLLTLHDYRTVQKNQLFTPPPLPPSPSHCLNLLCARAEVQPDHGHLAIIQYKSFLTWPFIVQKMFTCALYDLHPYTIHAAATGRQLLALQHPSTALPRLSAAHRKPVRRRAWQYRRSSCSE